MPIDFKDFEKGDAPGKRKKKEKKPRERKQRIPSYGLTPPREREVKVKARCFECREPAENKCLYCGRFFCDEHIHTDKHNCPDVKKRRW